MESADESQSTVSSLEPASTTSSGDECASTTSSLASSVSSLESSVSSDDLDLGIEWASNASQDEWDQCALKLVNSGKDSLEMVTIGKIGVGKSSLVNQLTGTRLAKEATSAGSITSAITAYTARVPVLPGITSKSIDVIVWDTPGLGDPSSNEHEGAVFEKCKHADVILYCMDMRQRLSRDDAKGIYKLIKRCGKKILKNVVFALTFGNKLEPPPGSDEEPREFFSNALESWQKEIGKLLIKCGVSENLIAATPIVPTGYNDKKPPDRTNWLDTFAGYVMRQVKDDAKSALVGICLNRLCWKENKTIELALSQPEPPQSMSAQSIPPRPTQQEPEPVPAQQEPEPEPPQSMSAQSIPPRPTQQEPVPAQQEPESEPVPAQQESMTTREKIEMAMPLIGGPVGGALIGGVVAKFAVGVVTGGGLVVGIAAGAVIGVGVGAFIAYLIYRHRKKKQKNMDKKNV